MENRRTCAHVAHEWQQLVVAWCAPCSGWRVSRVLVQLDSCSATGSTKDLLETHFLPVEDTHPQDLDGLVARLLRAAQECELDRRDDPRLLEY